MGAGDLTRLWRIPGRLSYGPTDLSTAWPHGGTGLGTVAEIRWDPGREAEKVITEAFGRTVTEILDGGESPLLACVLRDWDADALALLFPGGGTGATSGEPLITYPGSFRAGKRMTAIELLFTPDDQAAHPGILLYRAAPLVAADATLTFSWGEELRVACAFQPMLNANEKLYQIGLLEDMTL